MPYPMTPETWSEVADKFGQIWNFHNCIGAIDGKHIAIKCPDNSGLYYFNYKGFHSIILLALVDATYNDDRPMPFIIAGDDAFGLRSWLMKEQGNMNTVEHEIHACPKYSEFGSFAS